MSMRTELMFSFTEMATQRVVDIMFASKMNQEKLLLFKASGQAIEMKHCSRRSSSTERIKMRSVVV